jgi:hypothetical protein
MSEEKKQKIMAIHEHDKIRKELYDTFSSAPPEISMDLEIHCWNEKKQEAHYPPVHYKFDLGRMIWIPTLTNEKPYWEFEHKPDWAHVA